MIITVASHKGGVGKTTTAVHLAAYFAQFEKTLFIDGDPNRSASGWANRGKGKFPFKVIDERQAAKYSRNYEHIIIDTQARPEAEDLEALVEGCDLLILPSTPDALALDALMLTVDTLKKLNSSHYKILLTIIPPKPSTDGSEARKMLCDAGLPIFRTGIRRFSAYKKAALQGIDVASVKDSKAKVGWSDYLALGKEILSE